eukprot:CAMPEP_0116998696 /NCGR_PEP_ID=MMETSP0472-20121206/1680_1 /TAXON_ID=693140 ORGANISM="Tiarina fusus, Strain LIS" /NCGR_SAMPLE_ID=MMETSP0472 /ASSEMBLY_ACC=CAM_ASM_000603 /LENGTH=605 /DNA_ID=CAMNT_0004697931 /DNA_START=47 /DNA_END=1864 /DNA_ORIENTATION=+
MTKPEKKDHLLPDINALSSESKEQHGRNRPLNPINGNQKCVEAKQSRELESTLRQRGLLPGEGSDERRRRTVLDTLDKVLCKWCSSLQTARPNSENKWKRPRVALVTFGSYRLQVHRPDSDLDVLALSPAICTRGDFFTSLVTLLEEQPGVDDMHPIPSAFTPVLKFRVDGIAVDMLFARLADSTKLLQFQQKRPSPLLSTPTQYSAQQGVRLEYLIDDSDLASMDEAGMRSLNGVRVTQLILETVPDPDSFRIALAAIKQWACVHGLYSNVLGFLGGVNFAILVAWVCKRNPNDEPFDLLKKFFRTFASWKWPMPVTLAPIQRDPPDGIPSLGVWDPESNPRDRHHLMPIITPAYPSMNSSYNVGIPQLRRIKMEMTRASFLLERNSGSWKQLLRGSDFFTKHSNFLQITIRADDYEAFLKWQRLCESRLRILLVNLETPQISAWPFAKFFRRKGSPADVVAINNMVSNGNCLHESLFFVALRFAPGTDSVNLRYCTSDFLHKVNSWEERKRGMDLTITHILQSDLPEFVLADTKTHDCNLSKPAPVEMKENQGNLKSHAAASSEVHHRSSMAGTGTTRLTPKLARSTVSDDILGTPQKRHRIG